MLPSTVWSLPLSPSERRKETAINTSIAAKNGFNVDVPFLARRVFLRRSLNASRSEPGFAETSSTHFCTTLKNTSEKTKVKWFRLPYLDRSSDRLAFEFRHFGYHVGFYPLTRVQFLSKLTGPIPSHASPGVYRLICSCGDLYVGQAGQALSKCFLEHCSDFGMLLKLGHPDSSPNLSAMAHHCFEQNHSFGRSCFPLTLLWKKFLPEEVGRVLHNW